MKRVLFSLLLLISTAALAQDGALTSEVVLSETEKILGDSFGRSLYTFDIDQPGVSRCSGRCAEEWPPVLISAAEAALVQAPFSVHTRANGLLHLMLNNQPLYTYFLDRKVTDVKGDDIGGVWHIINL
jgi:predicted lipoprotein with Yx(FWY)xxD motif